MYNKTLLAAAILGVSTLAQAETTAPVVPVHPGQAQFEALQAQHLAAMTATMAHHNLVAPGYADNGLQERAIADLTKLNDRIRAAMVAMQEQMQDAFTLRAPAFDSAPMTRADVDRLFAERVQEMEDHFAALESELSGPSAPAAPDFPEYANDGRYEQLNGAFEARKTRFEENRKAAEKRMNEAREALKVRVQERSKARAL